MSEYESTKESRAIAEEMTEGKSRCDIVYMLAKAIDATPTAIPLDKQELLALKGLLDSAIAKQQSAMSQPHGTNWPYTTNEFLTFQKIVNEIENHLTNVAITNEE